MKTDQLPPQPEPVAYWVPKAEQFCLPPTKGRPFAKAWEPLYAAPPPRQWVDLTDHEIAQINAVYPLPQGFARAVSAALKAKNGATE